MAWFLLGASLAQAEFLQPVDVWVSNGQDTGYKLIDGSGFDIPGVGSPDAIHSTASSEMWSAIGSIKADAVFDLGQSVSLTKVYIWNYSAPGSTDVGMKDVEVQVSSDTNMTNANFTAIAQITLQEGGTTGQAFAVTGTDVRLVKLRSHSNWGQGYTVGLAEVRFESGTVVGKVPSVLITSLHEGDIIDFKTNTVLTLAATVTDKDNNLSYVEFFDGTNKLGQKSVAPYSWAVVAPAVGEHAFTVKATDKSGYSGWATVTVTLRELVADRIIQIDDNADIGTDTNQISYTGGWTLAPGTETDPRFQHNDHYDSTKNNYFEVRFVGVKIDLYATVASHHGTAKATIDGGTAYTVNYKAAQRAEQVHVWGSPILPQREHVLRVTVVGDGVVTADRFDVSVSDKPVDKAIIKNVTSDFTHLLVELEDVGVSVVNPATVKLFLDNVLQNPSIKKTGSTTLLSNLLATPLLPGSTHLIRVTALEMSGASITNETSLTLPAPWFPLTGLGGPPSIAGQWGLRQIWGAGRADAVVTAVQIALQANQPGFTGRLQDTNVSVINFSLRGAGAGIMPDDQPFPAEPAGLAAEDFVLAGRATVLIPSAGDWTIGVHSDDGFALRFIGAPFSLVSGNGTGDETFPEYMAFTTPTGNSSTLGVLTNLAAGQYQIEFIYFQRTGSANCEIFAAPGAWQSENDTYDWQLIGAPTGWQIVAGTPLMISHFAKAGNQLTLDFDTPQPDNPHRVLESVDLKTWQPATGVSLQKLGASTLRATISNATGASKFYRLALP